MAPSRRTSRMAKRRPPYNDAPLLSISEMTSNRGAPAGYVGEPEFQGAAAGGASAGGLESGMARASQASETAGAKQDGGVGKSGSRTGRTTRKSTG